MADRSLQSPQICTQSLAVGLATVLMICSFAGCAKKETTNGGALPNPPPIEKPISDVPQPSPTVASETGAVEPPEIEIAPGADWTGYIGRLQDAYDRIDPIKDGWESEAFSAAALEQLHHLEPLLLSPELATEEALGSIVTASITSASLRPDDVPAIFEDSRLSVKRAPKPDRAETASGIGAFRDQLSRLGAGSDPEHTKIKLKIFRVEPHDDGTTTSEVLCSIDSATSTGRSQINATWKCRWLTPAGAPPLLAAISVERYEEITQANSGTSLFEDCTASILSGNPSYAAQFLTQTDHWRARLPRDLGLDPVANHGLAIGDVNGDDLDDLYVCQQGGLPNRLFIQQPDGTLEDISEGSGTDWLDYCAAALFVDLDNDGDRDLVVSQECRMLVMSNDGQGRFTLEFGSSTRAQSFSMAAADYDNDGLLDLYVCGYNPSTAECEPAPWPTRSPSTTPTMAGRTSCCATTGNFDLTT